MTEEGAQDLSFSSNNDKFSQVMDPEKLGQVQGCGQRVTPTSLWGALSSHGTGLRNEYNAMKNKISELQEDRSRLKEKYNNLEMNKRN